MDPGSILNVSKIVKIYRAGIVFLLRNVLAGSILSRTHSVDRARLDMRACTPLRSERRLPLLSKNVSVPVDDKMCDFCDVEGCSRPWKSMMQYS